MGIIAKAGSTFKPCPAGMTQAVCVDVHDLGVIKTTYNGETKHAHKVDVYWEADIVNEENNKPFLVRKRYTCSLDPKSTLRKDLESWRGRPFTDQELLGFDLENLLSANCLINVAHVQRDGATYANVAAITPLMRGQTKIAPSAGYVRKKDRPDPNAANGAGPVPPVTATEPEEDDSIPF